MNALILITLIAIEIIFKTEVRNQLKIKTITVF